MSVTCLWDFLQIFLNGQTGVRTNKLVTNFIGEGSCYVFVRIINSNRDILISAADPMTGSQKLLQNLNTYSSYVNTLKFLPQLANTDHYTHYTFQGSPKLWFNAQHTKHECKCTWHTMIKRGWVYTCVCMHACVCVCARAHMHVCVIQVEEDVMHNIKVCINKEMDPQKFNFQFINVMTLTAHIHFETKITNVTFTVDDCPTWRHRKLNNNNDYVHLSCVYQCPEC